MLRRCSSGEKQGVAEGRGGDGLLTEAAGVGANWSDDG